MSQHLYEYKRGVRRLILHTTRADRQRHVEDKLRREGIAFQIVAVSPTKINVFFGEAPCVAVIREIAKSRLVDYTAEEDFLLGAMLGYDLLKQCDRYLEKKRQRHPIKRNSDKPVAQASRRLLQ